MKEPQVDVRYAIVRPSRLSVDAFAGRSGLHPEQVRRYVALGLLPATRDAGGRTWLDPREVATVGRIERLRAGLSLNYAAIGLVLDLLDRIQTLEAALRSSPARAPRQRPNARRPTVEGGSRPWT
jgi:DNA-binding transcriptional MerR regulator